MSSGGEARHLATLFERLDEVVGAPAWLRCLNLATEHYLTVEPELALRLAEALVAGGAWADLPAFAALGLLGRGDALLRVGRLAEAVAAFDGAGAAFRALDPPDEVGWARTRIGWIVAQHGLGAWQDVEATYEAAMAVFLAHGEALRAAKLAANAGVVAYERGDYDLALAHDDAALARAATLDASRAEVALLVARVRSNRALVAAEVGRFGPALAELQRAQDLFEAQGQTDSALAQALSIAYVQRAMGDYAGALGQLDRVARSAARQGLAAREANARHEQALTLLELGDCRSALWHAEQAQGLHSAGERESGQAADLLLLSAEIQATIGDPDEAFELLELAQALVTPGEGGPAPKEAARRSAAIALARAELLTAAGDPLEAEAEAARAEATFQALDRRFDAASAALARAWALRGLGRLEAARAAAEAALAQAREAAVDPLVAPCEHLLGAVARATNQPAEAAGHFAAALDALDALAGRVAPNLRLFFQASQHVYQDAIDLALASGSGAEAFGLLERSKSQALLAHLSREVGGAGAGEAAPDGAAPGDDPAQLARRHHYQLAQLRRLVEAPRTPAAERKIGRLRDEVRRLEAALQASQLGAAPAWPAWGPEARGGAPGPAAGEALEALRAALPADTVLVQYYLPPGSGSAFVLTRESGLTWRALDVTGRRIESRVGAWRAAVDEGVAARGRSGNGSIADEAEGADERAVALARQLYEDLVAPLAPLLAGRRRLVVVPYGAAHGLAFGALHDGRRFLLEQLDVTVALSGDLVRRCLERARPSGGERVVLGDDWNGRLPGCRREAEDVAAALGTRARLDGEASLAAVAEAAARPCAVLHIAAHGEARPDNPLFAHVALADGELTAMTAAWLPLGGALVTLSACETGVSTVAGGDEVLGLGWAFLAAGAATVVQSLWRIDDRLTARLMTDFYQRLGRGEPVSQALCGAQRACLAQPGARLADWAPYQVVGDPTFTLRHDPRAGLAAAGRGHPDEATGTREADAR